MLSVLIPQVSAVVAVFENMVSHQLEDLAEFNMRGWVSWMYVHGVCLGLVDGGDAIRKDVPPGPVVIVRKNKAEWLKVKGMRPRNADCARIIWCQVDDSMSLSQSVR
jgi:hypothetical protein